MFAYGILCSTHLFHVHCFLSFYLIGMKNNMLDMSTATYHVTEAIKISSTKNHRWYGTTIWMINCLSLQPPALSVCPGSMRFLQESDPPAPLGSGSQIWLWPGHWVRNGDLIGVAAFLLLLIIHLASFRWYKGSGCSLAIYLCCPRNAISS